jgi:hypothetical protein
MAYGTSSALNTTMVTAHQVTLTGLSSNTLYHFRVHSREPGGNPSVSMNFTFTTLAAPDTSAPVVAISAPASGATVSGTTTVSATASDNVGVVGVQFKRDGATLGAEDGTAPYSFAWNTIAAPNGSYVITAVARDAAGNTTTSAPVSVTVSNAAGTVVTLSPEDTSLNLDATNRSTAAMLTAYTWPTQRIANAILMRFDVSSLPSNANVQDATLQLALVDRDAAADPAYAVAAHKIVGRDVVIAAATGFTFDGVAGWTANACCNNNVPMAQADISSAYNTQTIDQTLGFKSWNLTTMVREWLADPATNFGLLLNSDASKPADRYRFFASMEHADPTLRPLLRVTYSVPPPDPTPPTVAITAPAAGATVSGTVAVSAAASDNVGVTSVQFQLDGANLGAADTSAPYSVSWNAAAATPGLHTLRAIARDAAGNATTSAGVAVTVADLTAPTVSITAPAAGASVSGTIPVTANATDAVGVAGVQFRLDGANLGAEDTSAPYAASWNTTAASDGSHTLTAVARDAAGNQRTSAAVSVTVSNSTGSPGGIAALYPGDVGIESHPDVIFTEMFEQSTIANMTSRYVDVNHSAGMSFTSSIPAGSTGSRALQMTTNGGSNEAAGLYKTFPSDQQWYLRYYVNYNSAVEYGHTSVWIGGYNPSLSFPNPQAGTRPSGNDRFSTGVEPLSFDNDRWMPYTYWKDMRAAGDGQYWGNVFLPSNTNIRMTRNRWYCVETMVKLNNPVTASNGELAVWIDGQRVLNLGQGFPNGSWSGGTFTENASGSPFGGFQWRSDSALNLNWLWLQNYVTGVPSSVQFDHVVLARSYVGCLAPAGPGDTTAPTVALTAPAGGATVSGSAVAVAATAADAGGIAGVQFKLDGVNIGAEDTTAPYSVSWNSAAASNGTHAVTAVARDAAGNTATSAAVTVTVDNPSSGGTWPNEPSGMTLLNDQPWSLLSGNGWSYLRRTSSKDASIVLDTAAPLSPPNVLRMVFTPDMQRDTEPSVHWMSVSGVREIYTAWWMKVSPNWSCSPAGCGKVTFLFTNGAGQVYTNLYHPASASGPPFRIGANTEWAPYGQQLWFPNVTTTLVHPGQWHRIEFYYRWETTPGVSGDGIIRWWVDGVLNGNHTNVHYPAASFNEFQFAPTLQNPPPAEQYIWIDHTRVSRK